MVSLHLTMGFSVGSPLTIPGVHRAATGPGKPINSLSWVLSGIWRMKEWVNEQMNRISYPSRLAMFLLLFGKHLSPYCFVKCSVLTGNKSCFLYNSCPMAVFFQSVAHGPSTPGLPGASVKTADSWYPLHNYRIRISGDRLRNPHF